MEISLQCHGIVLCFLCNLVELLSFTIMFLCWPHFSINNNGIWETYQVCVHDPKLLTKECNGIYTQARSLDVQSAMWEHDGCALQKKVWNSHSLFLVLCFLQRYVVTRQYLVALCRRIKKWKNDHQSFSMLNFLTREMNLFKYLVDPHLVTQVSF